ncbi:TauD/TfdA family dioxygenase [Mycobacterium sp. Y57]|uniref:TauD/TfdA dioxygenase family protein n=1 Tax=Mycolicibacterium xanthum TaxID=2796469 RepID=UPI001C847777|nr:TauD/TfdA family dioxygenase [Mycolicibacterium xanthum]MBX7433922.1 TauD/TfdA family dioxygenase [Mycolicibacterium xanthum]
MSGTAQPITSKIGLEVTGMTAGQFADPDTAQQAQRDLDEYGVVVYRDVNLSDDELVEFSRRLGTLVVQPTGEHQHPEIQTITLDPSKTNAMLASFRQGNFHWHIDGATLDIPQKATLLTARAVDPAGGDTEFANTYAAYDALSDAERTEIADLQVVHTFAHAQSLANPDPTAEQRAAWDRVPPQVHPLVWTRRSGRKSLLLGATAAEVVGWPIEKSRDLLDRLLAWATQPQFTLRHQWHVGDLVMWDNTGMLHRALPFEPTSVRLMHRTTLQGEEPVTAA